MNYLSKNHLTEPGYFPVVVSYYKTKWDTYQIEPHFHDRMELMYVTEGRCTVDVFEKPITLNAFSFILLGANVPHNLRISENCAILNIEIEFQRRNFVGTDLASLASQEPSILRLADTYEPFFLLKDEGSVFRTLLNLYEDLNFDKPDAPETLLLLSYLLIHLGKSVQDASFVTNSDYGYVNSACAYIKEHLEEKIKIADIAKHVHINSAYLQRLFKKVRNQTLVSYINEQRIMLAQSLLTQTDRNIAELSLDLGFSSQQYFSYLFKKCIGVSPQQFRKEHYGNAGKLNRVSYAEQRVFQDNLPEQKYIAEDIDREVGRNNE